MNPSGSAFDSTAQPAQPAPFPQCPACSGIPGPLQLCGGLGEDIHNYNRWYQKCSQCGKIIFHGSRTPLESIPEDVQLRYTINQSLRRSSSSAAPSGAVCGSPGCGGQRNGRARRANKECARVPAYCMACCQAAYPAIKCKAHRRSAVDDLAIPDEASEPSSSAVALVPVPSLAAQSKSTLVPLASTMDGNAPAAFASTPHTPITQHDHVSRDGLPVPPVTVRSYARPLSGDYAKPWVAAHQKKAEQAALVDASRQLQTQLANTVKVTMWTKASPHCPQRLQVTTAHGNMLVLSDHDYVVAALRLHVRFV